MEAADLLARRWRLGTRGLLYSKLVGPAGLFLNCFRFLLEVNYVNSVSSVWLLPFIRVSNFNICNVDLSVVSIFLLKSSITTVYSTEINVSPFFEL